MVAATIPREATAETTSKVIAMPITPPSSAGRGERSRFDQEPLVEGRKKSTNPIPTPAVAWTQNVAMAKLLRRASQALAAPCVGIKAPAMMARSRGRTEVQRIFESPSLVFPKFTCYEHTACGQKERQGRFGHLPIPQRLGQDIGGGDRIHNGVVDAEAPDSRTSRSEA